MSAVYMDTLPPLSLAGAMTFACVMLPSQRSSEA
jgi:hypothetical protein